MRPGGLTPLTATSTEGERHDHSLVEASGMVGGAGHVVCAGGLGGCCAGHASGPDHAGVGVSCWGDAVGAGHDGRLAPAAERSLCGATTGQPPNAVSTESLAGFPRYGKSYAIMTTAARRSPIITGTRAVPDAKTTVFLSGDAGSEHRTARRPGASIGQLPVVSVSLSLSRVSAVRWIAIQRRLHRGVGLHELELRAQRSQRSSHHSPPRLRQGCPREHHHDQLRWSGGLYESQRGRYDLRWRDQDLARLHPDHRGDALLFLSIFDQGDRSYDSAVFLDNLTINHRASCQSGVAATQ